MASFTIRVVLHDYASGQEYETLRDLLAAKRVYDYIQGESGSWYRLPDAEYIYNGNLTAVQVRDSVGNIVNTVKERNEVFVTESHSWAWVGLKAIPAP